MMEELAEAIRMVDWKVFGLQETWVASLFGRVLGEDEDGEESGKESVDEAFLEERIGQMSQRERREMFRQGRVRGSGLRFESVVGVDGEVEILDRKDR